MRMRMGMGKVLEDKMMMRMSMGMGKVMEDKMMMRMGMMVTSWRKGSIDTRGRKS